ncbi:hypothetical protein FJT64_007971 [Amphibalanus amphitrite]|uniref:Alpha/beta hydrolase fold-5 domain-containing protein n=1 Tax=Amphibalanus amphitrite TaxID=1232801 RepID=A0A6A4VRW9_AMPAM|nr:hypothetical protein FJT64_007971 [Amphibalanus amphitrite]
MGFRAIPLLLPLLAVVSDALILLPPETPGVNDTALIIVQGADVYPEQYRALGLAIQSATSISLWVAIPEGFVGNYPNPVQLPGLATDALAQLADAGMPVDAPVFLSGHSLGGIVVQGYAEEQADTLAGLLIFGSYLTDRPLATFPMPVLHLVGTLDGGQARPTRMSETYSELVALQAEDDSANLLKPVILLEAVNHAHFFSGEIPPTVAANDILSELDADEARVLIGARCAAFLAMKSGGADEASRRLLVDDYSATGEYLAPLYDLQEQEADSDDRSPWAEKAQRYMFNVLDESVTVDIQSYHIASLSELEHEHNQLNITGDLTADLSIFSSVEFPLDPVDAAPGPHASSELAVKMVSQELLAAKLPVGQFGDVRSCADVNQMTLAAAVEAAPPAAFERYQRRGLPVTYLEDHQAGAGPLWVQERLRLHYNEDGLEIQSVAIKTAPDSIFYGGSNYCKLLSPTRALEYVLIDSLKGTQP